MNKMNIQYHRLIEVSFFQKSIRNFDFNRNFAGGFLLTDIKD